jgi:beta-xylosidase
VLPARSGYFADPFVLRTAGGYAAYGTNPTTGRSGGAFEVLTSPDLRSWTSHGPSLPRLDAAFGDEYWAPEVAFADGAYWMYYSVGHGDAGHSIRVARSDRPTGPFADLGVDLTPRERFAIDPHPFQDTDGRWYLFYARDVLEGDRPGTHLAVDRLLGMAETAGRPTPVLAPNADWQIYQRDRPMYGATYDWHTLEGPSVVRRAGRYWLTYSGGSWQGPGYGVSWASAPAPLGPWAPAPDDAPRLLETRGDLRGPGHNSLTVGPDGEDVIAFHAWDADFERRELHLAGISFSEQGPRLGPPLEPAPA